jgi:hypothetical protein
MPYHWRSWVSGLCSLSWLALLSVAGCAAPVMHNGTSPLRPVQMSPDSVALDIFFVRFPFGDPTINGELWNEIDEQPFGPELRERLAQNGFRIGVVGGHIPVELSKLMALSDACSAGDEPGGRKLSDLDSEPQATQRRLQLPAGRRSEILASSVYEQLPVLVSKSGRISCATYRQAQGVFELKSLPQPDGRVRLTLVPELHHDQPRRDWDFDSQGILHLASGRPKAIYNDLAMAAELAPGAMLVVSSLPSRTGSLGHHFFTDGSGRTQQKLLIVRLSQTQHDGLLDPPGPLKLEQEQGARKASSPEGAAQ